MPDHSSLETVLSRCIAGDRYDPACLKENTGPLEALLSSISLAGAEEYQAWSREEKIALWVNTYTAWLLRILADLEPRRDVLLPIAPPFSDYRLVVLGEAYSLQEMQKKIWGEFRDERIFFVLANGTPAGPPFPEGFLTPARAEEALNRATAQYLKSPRNMELRKKELWLSSFLRDLAPFLVFNFGGSETPKRSLGAGELALINFLYQHAEGEELRSGLKQLDFKIRYFPPDFTLKRAGAAPKKSS